jgi:predicted O-methyltransferase YrrM
MDATNDAGRTADQEAFEKAIRDNLSPEGVATIIAFLQPATTHKPRTDEARKALREVKWFIDTLSNVLGVQEYNRLLDELGL